MTRQRTLSQAAPLHLVLGMALATATACAADDATQGDEHSSLEEARSLEWIGATQLYVGETYLPAHMVPADRSITVLTQTYPMGAAARVELHWASANYGELGSVEMTRARDGAGDYGNNTEWRAALPQRAVVADQDLHYWLRAEDALGNVVWDSNYGANHTVRPRRYDIGWIGGFGSYRPVNGDYVEGGLFNADASTSTGCWNHGVSASSYRARAVRVWVPGLTDQDHNPTELSAAKAILATEIFTDADASGWSSRPARFVRREGNDFLYQFQFVSFNPGCIQGLGDGTYEYKVRASTTGGASWFWRGSDNGPWGGDNLLVQYAARCSYFNNPDDCIPTETDITRHIYSTPLGAVIEYDNISIGASSTFTQDLVGGDRPVTVSHLRIDGPDADQFSIELVDAATNEYVPVDAGYLLETGDTYRMVLTYRPTVTSPGVLPHQATVVWNETGSSPTRTTAVQGVFLRGTTP